MVASFRRGALWQYPAITLIILAVMQCALVDVLTLQRCRRLAVASAGADRRHGARDCVST